MDMETAPVNHSVGQLKSCLGVSAEERKDQDSRNELYAMESDENSQSSSDDHQSMDTPNTFEGNTFSFSISKRKLDAFDLDQQSGTEADRHNGNETKESCLESCLILPSSLRALLLTCVPFCRILCPRRDEADCDG